MMLLLALLGISYVGSMLMGGRGLRGYGLPSGSEWVLIGFVIGPHALSVVTPETLRAFEPIAAVAVGWMGLLIGVAAVHEARSGKWLAPCAGLLLALVTMGVVSLAVFYTVPAVSNLRGRELYILALGVGLVSCETTQHAVEWVVQRYAARGPLAEFVRDMAAYDDIAPLLLMAVPFSLAPSIVPIAVPWWAWSFAPIVLGVLLGGTSAVLVNFEKHAGRGWGVLLGAVLLTSGIAWRIGVSPLTAMLALGLSIALFSRHRAGLHSMLSRNEHTVLLPSLVLAGASIHLDATPMLLLTLAVAWVGRLLVRLLAAPLIARLSGAAPRPGRVLGLALLPTGAVTMMVGLTFALRFPERVGPVVLCVAALQTAFGEALGPASLRRALAQAGEIPQELAIEEPAVAGETAALPAGAAPDPEQAR
jgi:hypothetical protein